MSIRVSGLASGIDTETMVNELIQVERMRTVDPLEQQKQLLEWKQEYYREINTKFLALKNALFDLKLQGTFMAKAVSSSDETVLTATAGANAIAGNYNVTVNSLANGVNVASYEALGSNETKTTLADQFTGIAGTITFTLETQEGSAEFSFDTSSTSISGVVAQINSAGIGVVANYDENVDRFFLMTSDTGSEVKTDITADAEGFLRDNLKLYTGDLATESTPVNLGTGQDANIDFAGAAGLTFASNQFTLNGINFNLVSEGSSTVSVNNDLDSIIEKINAFVEAYNSVVEYVGGKLAEKRYWDYPPLTDTQREEMTESQIELWEEKAKSGLFRGDFLLNSVYSKTRTGAMSLVEGLSADNQYNSLSSIGINTRSYYEYGKLYVDEDQLREALTSNLEGVMELFTNSGDTQATQGIAYRLYNIVDENIEIIVDKAGSSSYAFDNSFIGKEIRRINEHIDTMEERLNEMEERYWRQFTAMERALQQMNSQSMWLMQQLGINSGT